MDQYLNADCDSLHPLPRAPLSIGGDLHWYREYGSARPLRLAGTASPVARAADLRDHVQTVLRDLEPEMPLELLRSGGSTRPLVLIRKQVIARALSAGYVGTRVAQFLNISPTTVSRVKARLRDGAAW